MLTLLTDQSYCKK